MTPHADCAQSSAASWNAASRRVSERLGYRRNGTNRVEIGPGEIAHKVRVRLHRDDFNRPDWNVDIQGVSAAVSFPTGQ